MDPNPEVAFGCGPITRASQLQQGEWGMSWDVYVDVGAAPVAARCR